MLEVPVDDVADVLVYEIDEIHSTPGVLTKIPFKLTQSIHVAILTENLQN